MNDQQIETEIQAKGLTAPRVTPADIEENIASELYFTADNGLDGADIDALRRATPDKSLEIIAFNEDTRLEDRPTAPLGLLTFCVLILKNGFTVTGESACASPENFDAELGRKIARQNAINKVWPLMGYELKCRMAREAADAVS